MLRRSDVDHFRAYVSRFLTPHQLTPVESKATVLADLSRVELGPIALVHGRNAGDELRVRLTEQVSYYDVNLALGGHNLLECGDERLVLTARTAGVISPRMLAEMRLSDGYSQLHVRIERHALERQLERLLGRPVPGPIRFRPEMDLTVPAAGAWARTVRILVQDLDEPSGLVASGGEVNPWSDFLLTGLLLAQPHNYSEQLAQRQAAARRPAPVRRVVELIDREPEGDLSLARLAAVAGVAPRSLQRHFHAYLGVSPREYILSVRLARAHDDLVSGNARTVAEVAFRWGLTHVPRFAGSYQERYGVSPSTTLRMSRPGAAEPGPAGATPGGQWIDGSRSGSA